MSAWTVMRGTAAVLEESGTKHASLNHVTVAPAVVAPWTLFDSVDGLVLRVHGRSNRIRTDSRQFKIFA